MNIAWRSDLETGDKSVDSQHRVLFQKIDELIIACKEGRERQEVANLIGFLKRYVQVHFSAEAGYQARQNYPYCREHGEQHAILVRSLAALEESYLQEGASLPVVTNSLKLTYEWLTWHILKWDKQMTGKGALPAAAGDAPGLAFVRSDAAEIKVKPMNKEVA